MRFWQLNTLLSVSLLILSGCGGIQPLIEQKKTLDATLPVVTLTKNGIITDMTGIAFEWKSITDPRVRAIGVYKYTPGDGNESMLSYYTTLPSRFKTHYVDDNVKPDTRYKYAFKVYADESEGKMSNAITVNSKPVLASVSWIHSITGLPRSAKIIWRPHKNQRVAKYIIERKTLDQKEWEEIDTLSGRLNAEYLDTDLKDNYVYMYRLRVKTFDGIVSTPSQMVKVVTKPLPRSVESMSATKNLPKKIKIDWRAQKPKDFKRFYLYRSKAIDGDYELIAKLHNPTFTDEIAEDGAVYFYRVSIVDKDGLESEHEKRSVMGMSLPKPAAPAIFKAEYNGNVVALKWSNVDPRSVSYEIVREQKKGWFETKTKTFRGIQQTSFIDNDLEPDSTYRYTVYSVDVNGIKSESSVEAVVVTPESQEIIEPKQQKIQTQTAKRSQEVQPQEVITPINDLDLNEL
ncbi:MAG: fibronectin type III domain-containing protein [Epsilonproteobacteria bacterium]|nr:fibronectin type III domain-containing protein [Campylobacterota bacterium]